MIISLLPELFAVKTTLLLISFSSVIMPLLLEFLARRLLHIRLLDVFISVSCIVARSSSLLHTIPKYSAVIRLLLLLFSHVDYVTITSL